MKFVLETHRYAPELNRLIFANGATLRSPNAFTIRGARSSLFKRLPVAKVARVTVTHTRTEHKCCDKVYVGRINSLHELLKFKNRLKTKHNLPDAQIKIESVKLVG